MGSIAAPSAGNVPVVGGGSGGNSNKNGGWPDAVAIDAVRKLTERSTSSPSSLAPTAKAFGGLPSTAIKATPCWLGVAGSPGFGAITPTNRKRDATSGAATLAVVTAAVAPRRRARSPRKAAVSPTGTACSGA